VFLFFDLVRIVYENILGNKNKGKRPPVQLSWFLYPCPLSKAAACLNDRVAKFGKLICQRSQLGLDLSQSLAFELVECLLSFVESGTPHLALLFQLGNELIVTPADSCRQVTQAAVLASGFESEVAQRPRHDHLLEFVIRVRHAFEHLQALESQGASLSFVRDHATDGAPENARWLTVVERSSARVGVRALLEEQVVLEPVAKERARNVNILCSDCNHFAAIQELFGQVGSQTTQKVVPTIDEDGLFDHLWIVGACCT